MQDELNPPQEGVTSVHMGEPTIDVANAQELRSYVGRPAGSIPVMEIFGPTIQGEGSMIGVKTMFLRTGGCDYRCTSCDSMHAVMPQAVKKNAIWTSQEEIAAQLVLAAQESNTQWVTLSGGNPVMWDMTTLINMLHAEGIRVALETQGSIWRDWINLCDVVTVSPKGPGMGERFVPQVFRSFLVRLRDTQKTSCVKIPVFSMLDIEFAVGVDQILDEEGFPIDWRYLSVGNSLHPVLGDDLELHEPGELDEIANSKDLPDILLHDYKASLEMDFLPDKRLSNWKYLPQLHVLIWGNKSLV